VNYYYFGKRGPTDNPPARDKYQSSSELLDESPTPQVRTWSMKGCEYRWMPLLSNETS
jgi:hypothetical protein